MEYEFTEHKDENGWQVPVWILYPDRKPWDLFWGLGSYGYEYAYNFHSFIDSLSEDELERYKEKYPVPAGWKAWVTNSGAGNIEEIRSQDATDYWNVHEWMEPPWTVGDEPYGIGWNMGSGETYAYEFGTFIEALSYDDLKKYNRMYPTPPGWKHWVTKEKDTNSELYWQDDVDYTEYQEKLKRISQLMDEALPSKDIRFIVRDGGTYICYFLYRFSGTGPDMNPILKVLVEQKADKFFLDEGTGKISHTCTENGKTKTIKENITVQEMLDYIASIKEKYPDEISTDFSWACDCLTARLQALAGKPYKSIDLDRIPASGGDSPREYIAEFPEGACLVYYPFAETDEGNLKVMVKIDDSDQSVSLYCVNEDRTITKVYVNEYREELSEEVISPEGLADALQAAKGLNKSPVQYFNDACDRVTRELEENF